MPKRSEMLNGSALRKNISPHSKPRPVKLLSDNGISSWNFLHKIKYIIQPQQGVPITISGMGWQVTWAILYSKPSADFSRKENVQLFYQRSPNVMFTGLATTWLLKLFTRYLYKRLSYNKGNSFRSTTCFKCNGEQRFINYYKSINYKNINTSSG